MDQNACGQGHTLTRLWQPLGELERLAAFQAARLAARCDQSAKRAHPLRSRCSVIRLERRKQLGEPICHESKPSTQAIAEPTNIGFHRSTFTVPRGAALRTRARRALWEQFHARATRQLYDGRSGAAILCRIAHIDEDSQFETVSRASRDMSNSDQLFSTNRATMEGGDEHFRSLFQVL